MPIVIESGSKQYTVVPGQRFVVDRLQDDVNLVIPVKVIYAYGDEAGTTKVRAKVVAHQKGKKIRVVKYKSKSNYHRQYGYRHYETVLEIEGGSEKPVTTSTVEAKQNAPVTSVASVEVEPAKKTIKKNVEDDQFQKLEGIGPKIEELLKTAGITTYEKLAGSEIETLKKILSNAGSRFTMHDPSSWPIQAALAAVGKWDELKALQDQMDGGKLL